MRLDETISGIKGGCGRQDFRGGSEGTGATRGAAPFASRRVPGAADAQMEITSGVAELHIEVDRPALARYGLNVTDVRELVEAAIGGAPSRDLIEGQRRFAIVCGCRRIIATTRRACGRSAACRRRAASGSAGPGGAGRRRPRPGNCFARKRPAPHRRAVQRARPRSRQLRRRSAAPRSASELQLPAGLLRSIGAASLRIRSARSHRLMIVLPVSVADHFRAAVRTFDSARQAMLILLQCAVRAGRRHRGAVDPRAESEPFGAPSASSLCSAWRC